MFDFTEEELQRYSRHILLQEVGVEGQKKYAGDGCSLSVPVAWVRRLPSILRLQVWG